MPLHIEIPGRDPLDLRHLVCDLNGTLSLDGVLLDGLADRIAQLAQQFTIHLVTADTYGTLESVMQQLAAACAALNVEAPTHTRVTAGEEKEQFVRQLGADGVVALGNGRNDMQMFSVAALGICVLGPEGTYVKALQAADIVVPSPHEGLDLLLHPKRLIATLRF